MTPRFLFPARMVTKNPSVWIRDLNDFFHRATFTIYLQYTEFHTPSCYPAHPDLAYFGDLEVSMTLWGQSRLLQEWGLHSLSEHQEMHSMFLPEHCGQDCSGAGNHGQMLGYVKLFCMPSRRKCIFLLSNMFMPSVILTSWTVIMFHNNSKAC